MPSAQAKMRDMNESMIWWFQALDSTGERLNCCRYSGQPIKNRCTAYAAKSTIYQCSSNTYLWEKTVSSTDKVGYQSPRFTYRCCLEKTKPVKAYIVTDYEILSSISQKVI